MQEPAEPLRKVFVFGGSNSLLKGGWVDQLAKKSAGRFQITNRSIGAATSLMGLYRAATTPEMAAGDIAIWEYGLNDYTFYRNGDPLPVLIQNLTRFLIHCRGRGVHVVPLLMNSRIQMIEGAADPYLTAARRLFDQHKIAFVDCAAVLQTHLTPAKPIPSAYRDALHYKLNIPFMRDLVSYIQKMAAAPRGAAAPLDVPALAGRGIKIVTEFTGQDLFRLKNAIIDCAAYPVAPKLSARLEGELLGLIVRSEKTSRALRFSAEDWTEGPFSTRNKQKDYSWLLKHINVAAAVYPERYRANSLIVIDVPKNVKQAIVQPTFCPPNRKAADHSDAVIALIVEVSNEQDLAAGAPRQPRRAILPRLQRSLRNFAKARPVARGGKFLLRKLRGA